MVKRQARELIKSQKEKDSIMYLYAEGDRYKRTSYLKRVSGQINKNLLDFRNAPVSSVDGNNRVYAIKEKYPSGHPVLKGRTRKQERRELQGKQVR
jgi:hypothetical protein